MRLDLSPEDVATLEARTEGWIAGLQMAALSMRGRKDMSGFIKAFSSRQGNSYHNHLRVQEKRGKIILRCPHLSRRPNSISSPFGRSRSRARA